MKTQFIYDTFAALHIDSLYRLMHRAPAVLFYHGVAIDPNPVIETESIPLDLFVRQLNFLKKHYHVISCSEFEERFFSNKWDGREVLLTFDDGYRNMLTTALPVLVEFGFPFILFLTTNNISRDELFATTVNRLIVLASSINHIHLPSCNINTCLTAQNRSNIASQISILLKRLPYQDVQMIVQELCSSVSSDEMESLRSRFPSVNPMNWSESRQVASSELCTIGSHGVNHICCHENQPIEIVEYNIYKSKCIIEEQLGITCAYFSYPNGSFTEQSNKVVEDAGYRLGFSTKRMPIQALTKWNIPRLYVPYDYARFVYSISTYPK